MTSVATKKIAGAAKSAPKKTTAGRSTAAKKGAEGGAFTFASASAPQATLDLPPIPPSTAAMVFTAEEKKAWQVKPAESLTDREILAMPDSEYMRAVQLAFFRHRLMQARVQMLASAGETTEHLREENVVVPDPADRATIEEEHALELRTRDRERKLLKKIEQSIARIDADDYGYCDETGEPIGLLRLLARPTATLSLEAQERRELRQKIYGN